MSVSFLITLGLASCLGLAFYFVYRAGKRSVRLDTAEQTVKKAKENASIVQRSNTVLDLRDRLRKRTF